MNFLFVIVSLFLFQGFFSSSAEAVADYAPIFSTDFGRSLHQHVNDESELKLSYGILNRNLTLEEIGDLVQFLEATPSVYKVVLHQIGIKADGAALLAKFLQRNKTVTHFSLPSNFLYEKGICNIARALQGNTTLQVLNLSNTKPGLEGIHELSLALRGNKTLKALYLNINSLGDSSFALEAAQYIANIIRETGLEEIQLDQNNLQAPEIAIIADALSQTLNPCLLKVNLNFNKLNIEGIRYLATTIAQNKVLLHLKLSCTDMGSEAAEILASALESSSLCTLELEDAALGSAGVCAILRALQQKNNTLQSLLLGANGIGAQGAHEIAPILSKVLFLKELDLAENELGFEGALAIVSALPEAGLLEILYLGANGIDEQEAAIIKKACRNKKIKIIFEEKPILEDEYLT